MWRTFKGYGFTKPRLGNTVNLLSANRNTVRCRAAGLRDKPADPHTQCSSSLGKGFNYKIQKRHPIHGMALQMPVDMDTEAQVVISGQYNYERLNKQLHYTLRMFAH